MSKPDILSLRDILHIFFKNKRTTILIVIISLICSLSYCILTTKTYRAESDILIKMGREKFTAINSMTGVNYNVVFQERTQNINDELGILMGTQLFKRVFPEIKMLLDSTSNLEKPTVLERIRSVFKAVIKGTKELVRFPLYRLGLAKKFSESEALALEIQEQFHAEYLEDTDIIRLTFDWSNPDFAAKALDIYTNEFLLYHTEVHNTKGTLDLYSSQIDIHKQDLERIENEIQDLYRKNNISNIEEQKKVLLSDISNLEQKYFDILTKIKSTNIKIQEINRMMELKEEWIETPNIGYLGQITTDLNKLDQIYFDLKAKKEELRIDFTDSSKEIRDINRQLARLKKQKWESLINLLDIEMNSLSSQKTIHEQLIAEKKDQLAEVSLLKIQLEKLERTRSIAQDRYLLYSKKTEDFRIFNELDKSQILSLNVINPALPPLLPYHPRKWLILGITAVLALFFSFGYSIIREYFSHDFKGRYDVEEHLSLPLLATVPDFEELQLGS